MRAVWQRVLAASVEVDGYEVGRIGRGALVFLGVEADDTEEDAIHISDKVASLRVFDDEAGRLNRSVIDVGGSILVVSQFTLCGDCRKGRRPSFAHASHPDEAHRLYERVVGLIRDRGCPVATGRFQARMVVHVANDGPVTLLLDSRRQF